MRKILNCVILFNWIIEGQPGADPKKNISRAKLRFDWLKYLELPISMLGEDLLQSSSLLCSASS